MANIKPVICGGTKVYKPKSGCDECDYLEARVEALETFLAQYEEIDISMTDEYGETVTAHVLGWVERVEPTVIIEWEGIDPANISVNEEFDEMEGINAIGCNGADCVIEFLGAEPIPPVEEGGESNE